MTRILFICHGNICRSPMAEFVMKDIVEKNNARDLFYIASAATSTEALGCCIHRGTREKLSEAGIQFDNRKSVQLIREDYDKYDYLIAMDSYNVENIMDIIGSDTSGKVCRLLDFTGECGDIPDPWYTGDFESTYCSVLRGCKALFEKIMNNNFLKN